MVFECYGLLIEVAGYLFMGAMFLAGQTSGHAFLAFLALAFSLGFLLSVSALMLEEMSFHLCPRFSQWLLGTRSTWGTMTREGSWQK